MQHAFSKLQLRAEGVLQFGTKTEAQETLSIQRYLVNSKETPNNQQKQGETSFHSVYTEKLSNSYNSFTVHTPIMDIMELTLVFC